MASESSVTTSRRRRRRLAVPPAPVRPGFFQAGIDIETRGVNGGNQAEDDSGEQRNEKGEGEDASVDVRGGETRKIIWLEPEQKLDTPTAEQQSGGATEKRKQQAFGEHLTDQTESSGTHAGTNYDCAAARGRAGQQQAGEIHAGNQQDQTYGGKQKQKSRTGVADDALAQRNEAADAAGVMFRILLTKGGVDSGDFGLGLGEADAGLEAHVGVHEINAAFARGGGVDHTQRGIDVRRFALQPEIRGHDSDNLVEIAAQRDVFADGGGIAGEMLGPKRVAEQHDARAAVLIFAGRDQASEERMRAERGEKLRVRSMA